MGAGETLAALETTSKHSLAKGKIDDFFIQWLSLPHTQEEIAALINDAKHDRPLQAPSSPSSPRAALKQNQHPPKSPTGAPSSKPDHTLFGAASPSATTPTSASPARTARSSPAPSSRVPKEVVPPFYFPKPKLTPQHEVAEMAAVRKACARMSNGATREDFREILTSVYELPGVLAGPWFDRMDRVKTGRVAPQKIYDFCQTVLGHGDANTHFFRAIKASPERTSIVHDDFVPFMKELLVTHAGLEFLKPTPEFQERYVETVIVRIFYTCNLSGDGKLTLREIRKHKLLATFRLLDTEKDINKVTRFFSYEHFYVLYCKFWELDSDHDFLIDKEDVLRYANYSLTYRIIDRVFQEAPRKLSSGHADKMGYADFIWFLLSEEDKTSPTSFEYWFKCIDLNGNGMIEPDEMEYFYREQMHRMECLSLEVVSFADILCQLTDMVKIYLGREDVTAPDVRAKIVLRDMRRCRMGGNFFNVLFNLNKFIAFEQRDPAVIFQERMTPELTDWDRFAHAEYMRLSMEDEEGEGEAWDGQHSTS